MNKNLFIDKDHYLAFLKAWSEACNDNRFALTSTHHILYLLLRDKDVLKSFQPVVNKRKLGNGCSRFRGLKSAYRAVEILVGWAKSSIENPMYRQSYCKLVLDKALLPFAGTVTAEMIAKLQLPKFNMLAGIPVAAIAFWDSPYYE